MSISQEKEKRELVTKAEFARMMGVDRRTPGKWARSGRITLVGDKIDPVAAKAELKATGSPQPHHMARRAQIERQKAESAAAAEQQPPQESGGGDEDQPTGSGESVGLRLQLARARYEENRADMARLDRDQRAGLLMLRADADYVLDDMGRRLASLLDRLADQITPTLVGMKGDAAAIHATLSEAHRDLRVELSHYLQQQGQQESAP